MRPLLRHCFPLAAVCGVLASAASGDVTYGFNTNEQGFTTQFVSEPFEGPWVYSASIGMSGTGGWSTKGQTPDIGHKCTVDLIAPAFVVSKPGTVRLSFNHRFSFEYDGTRWDAGAVFISVNDGPVTMVPASAFVLGGYDNKVASNSLSALANQMAFTAKSTGYDTGAFVATIADLGQLNAGDSVQVRFRFAGDTNTTGGIPTWAIDNVSLQDGFIGASLTYQGVLRDGGEAISGPVDLRFSLYGSATSTAAADRISGPIAMNGVAVGVGGVLTVPVNFGPGSYNERPKWIEVEVKQGGNYTRLLPRIAVTPVPNAVYASNAGSVPWTGVVGAPTELGAWKGTVGGIQYANGNVGIGTTTPTATLHVTSADSIAQLKVSAAPTAPFGAFLSLDASEISGGQNWVMFSTGGSASEGAGKLIHRNMATGAYGPIIDNAGRVGLQIAAPSHTLDVYGTIGVENGDNGVFFARASTGESQPWMWPRWTDDWMYTNFGPNGWRIRANDNSEVITLLPNRNIGIGTTEPGFRLHVASTNSVPTQLESTSTTGTWLNLLNTSPGGMYWRAISTGQANGEGPGKLLFGVGSTASTHGTVMTLQNNGNVGIGTAFPTQRLTVNGNVLANNVAVPSSGRFKDHVERMDDALESLLKLEGVRFDWKPEWAKARPGREHDIGFVAEDVAKVFPEVVFHDEQGNVTGMDYSRLTAVAVEAIKQQQVRFDAELAKRDRENAELRARLEKLEKLMQTAGSIASDER